MAILTSFLSLVSVSHEQIYLRISRKQLRGVLPDEQV